MIPPFKPVPSKKETHMMTFDAGKNTFRRNGAFEMQKSESFEIVPGNTKPLKMTSDTVQPKLSLLMGQSLLQTENPINEIVSFDIKSSSVPAFQSMPSSITRLDKVSLNQTPNRNQIQSGVFQPDPMPLPPSNKLPVIDLMGHSVEELAAAANVSVDIIKSAIYMRQQELLAAQQAAAYHKLMIEQPKTAITTPTITTTTTTTPRPIIKKPIGGGNKVNYFLAYTYIYILYFAFIFRS